MKTIVGLTVPWAALLGLGVACWVLLFPRLDWPSPGAMVIGLLLIVFAGPYLAAAVTISLDLLAGRALEELTE